AVQPEHDKTTKTELQEEADPEVLRAKQAATAQFSGTANLGQSRDLGTEGNNAMDQAVSNLANAGQVEKKPSGSWFIWVFLAILVIGLALWLFNMGGA
ncbi:peptide-binding protein, partial [Psychrobacter namhaensis]